MRAVVPLPPPPGNALDELTDEQLWNLQVLLNLGCGRAKSSITRRREQYYCFLGRVIKVEADLRGVPQPGPDDKISSLNRA
jgi:hypothetical protein